jgi:hypothetical protein
MSTDRIHITPEQARERLTAAQMQRPLPSPRDRKVHAIGTAAFGVGIGLFMAAQNMLSGPGGEVLRTALFFAVYLGVAVWVERATRTVPRRVRLWSRLGIAGSMVLALVAVLPWLNLHAQSEPNTWTMVFVGTLVAGAPSLLAAAVIARGRR